MLHRFHNKQHQAYRNTVVDAPLRFMKNYLQFVFVMYHSPLVVAREPCPKFLEYLVILFLERRYPKQNTVARLKSNILTQKKFWAGYATVMYAYTRLCDCISKLFFNTLA